MRTTKHSVLFIACTHGNETIGVDGMRVITSTGQDRVDWIIGNELAYKAGTRSTDGRTGGDLNRSAPGRLGSLRYEERRAAEILLLARQYKYVVDLHGCPGQCGVFIIISKITRATLQLASLFPITRIVLWPQAKGAHAGATTAFVDCGISVECGDEREDATLRELTQALDGFLHQLHKSKNVLPQALQGREIYQVVGVIPSKESQQYPNLTEFGVVNVDGVEQRSLFVDLYPLTHAILLRPVTADEALALLRKGGRP